MKRISAKTPEEIRMLCRSKKWTSHTMGAALGYVQANLIVLPKKLALDFTLFAIRNPKPCTLIDVCEPGDPIPLRTAPGADLRFDLPRYRIYKYGELVDEPLSIEKYWREDFVTFLVGCGATVEQPLLSAGIPSRHIKEGKNVAMYNTNISCVPAGIFKGNLVVSMRPIPSSLVSRAVITTSRIPFAHGAPVHIGNPSPIGISDIADVNYGEYVPLEQDDVPVFWACGVTPQLIAQSAKPEIMITHSPGHMFITDKTIEEMLSI